MMKRKGLKSILAWLVCCALVAGIVPSAGAQTITPPLWCAEDKYAVFAAFPVTMDKLCDCALLREYFPQRWNELQYVTLDGRLFRPSAIRHEDTGNPHYVEARLIKNTTLLPLRSLANADGAR